MGKKKKRLKQQEILRQQRLFEKLVDRKKITWDNYTYGIQRMDLLIISISSAGIYACLEFSKFLFEQNFCGFTISLFRFPAIVFILSIVSNLISQRTGYNSNRYDWMICNEKIECHGNIPSEIITQKIADLDCKAQRLSTITDRLNSISLYCLILGLGLLIGFYIYLTF